jgi:hypothetical protein
MLLRQSKDREADMLVDPRGIRADLEAIDRKEKPDLWVSNQLSYAVTLALHCLGLPFVSFCPPHPLTIPEGGKIYGVPASWPKAIHVDPMDLQALRETAREVEKAFTGEFNRFLKEGCVHAEPVDNAFALTSSLGVLCNYPDFGNDPPHSSKIRRIYLGACVEEQELPERFGELLEKTRQQTPRILMVMGTFLSYRGDVLKACIESAKEQYPESSIFVGAGASADKLKGMGFQDVFIEEFIPQKALLPRMDVVIHHGGNNSFTESLYHGIPMVILPFSSDQFDVAADAERLGIAEVLDPNSLTASSLGRSLKLALSKRGSSILTHWQGHVRGRGPLYGVRELAALGL